MKKPNVLNRSMFNQGGTSAYGQGITSNLVSDEQRQRFNYGGRVGYKNRGYVDVGYPWEYPVFPTRFSSQRYIPDLPQGYTPILSPGKRGDPYTKIQDYGFTRDEDPQGEKTDYIPISGDDKRLEKLKMAPKYENLDFTEQLEAEEAAALEAAETGVDPTPDSGRVFEDTAGDWRKNIAIPGVVEEEIEGPFGGEPGTPIPGERDPSLAAEPDKPIRTDTDELDTPDKWAFLDENIAKKKKLARGHAFMEGAAAAADWAVAGTPEKKGAAVSKGLRSVGAIGAKYKGEAEDIKTKAKILGTVEEIKGEQKQKLWQDRLKGYYQPSLDIAEQGLALKKAAAELAAEGKDGLSIYDDILLTDSKSLRDPFTKRDILRSLTGKNLQVEGEKNKKTLNSEENEGLIFIDIQGNVVKNMGDGTTKGVDETRDEFFTWRN